MSEINPIALEVLFLLGTVLGGLGAASWSLMIMISPIYTVMTDKICTPRQEKIVFAVVHFALFLYVILTWQLSERAYDPVSLHYSEVRIWMIGLDMLAFAWMAYIFRARVKAADRSQNPLYHVLRRLVFYPIIQVITRLGAVCFNVSHGYSEMIPQPKSGQSVLLFIGVFLTPAAGLGAFIAFLYLQNGAATQLKRMLSCNCSHPTPEEAPRDGRSQSRSTSGTADRALSIQEENLPPGRDGTFQGQDEMGGIFPDQWTRLSIMDEAKLMQKFLDTNETATNQRASARAGFPGAQLDYSDRGSSLASNNLEMNTKNAYAIRPSV
jgi:hypothetical protein